MVTFKISRKSAEKRAAIAFTYANSEVVKGSSSTTTTYQQREQSDSSTSEEEFDEPEEIGGRKI